MKKEISDLVAVSQFYGQQKDYTLGGGGNTSYKDQDKLYVKASGHSLASITEKGFAVVDRAKLRDMRRKSYSQDTQLREYEVKEDLLKARIDPISDLRPSVETLLHDSIEFAYVVHTHPHMVNGLLCAKDAAKITKEMFGDKAIFVPYADPGIVLSRTVLEYLEDYRKDHVSDPHYIFLQNHGVFVNADTVEKIQILYQQLRELLLDHIKKDIRISHRDISAPAKNNTDALREYLTEEKYLALRFNSLVQHFTRDNISIKRIEKPFIPDQIVYCKAYPLIIPFRADTTLKGGDFDTLFNKYWHQHGYEPKIILFQEGPMAGIEEDQNAAELVLDIFEDAMKISFYSNYFGGPNFMSEKDITFIENWEAENYRRKIAKT